MATDDDVVYLNFHRFFIIGTLFFSVFISFIKNFSVKMKGDGRKMISWESINLSKILDRIVNIFLYFFFALVIFLNSFTNFNLQSSNYEATTWDMRQQFSFSSMMRRQICCWMLDGPRKFIKDFQLFRAQTGVGEASERIFMQITGDKEKYSLIIITSNQMT